ncbi:MAG: phytanoyl-CoA dioxygenase family protein [Candidatus Pelagibacterales bacterium]|nr:MAG: phytanoyl-CoA dioxygenase family protein [Pelagibacterales bacterium]
MSSLTSDQLNQYKEEGFIAPIDVLSSDEALKIRKEIENIETNWPKELEGIGRNYVHMISPVFDNVCHNTKILDAVESIIGKNILICGTTLFIKNPNQKGFVSFHQDAKYIGLEPHNWVTAWIAITDANEENGCMKMWSGSHKKNIQKHSQKFNENNLLTRGQTIENVPIEETTSVILKAGQMSLHHPTIVHGSGLNKTEDRRIGFVVQSYIGSNVEQILGKMYVQQARGIDEFKYHEHTKRPVELMSQNDIKTRKKANEELSKIFYSGSKQKGKY